MRWEELLGVRRCLIAVAALAASAFGATPAAANTLTITAQGTVPASCGLAASSTFGSANLNASGSVSATAQVNCNTPFRIRAVAAQGVMKNPNSAPAFFGNSQAYNLTVTVPLDSGSQVAATCPSSSLIAGSSSCTLSPASASGLSSGNGTSMGKAATLAVQWTLGGTPLLAGTYSDTITVTIAAQS